MKNYYLNIFIKKIFIISVVLFFATHTFCNDNPSQVASKMKAFFTKTLTATYGDKPVFQLYSDFLTDYKNRKGDVALVINVDELREINQLLFSDSIYYYYYPKLLFFNGNYNDFFMGKDSEVIDHNCIVFFNKPDQIITKHGIYLNNNKNRYFKNIVDEKSHIKAVREINKYYFFSGILSYFMFADILLNNNEDIKDDVLKELTAVVFWKYLCERVDISFYK